MSSFAALVSLSFLADPTVPPESIDLTTAHRVLTDVAADGSVYALGKNWKMTFERDGASFLPILGARAPNNLGLRFALKGIANPRLEGQRVTIDRGEFVEVYDLALESVEQSFFFEKRPHDGDLTVRLPISTELQPLPRDVRGLRFGALDLGEVIYGDATIVDAAGRKLARHSEFRDGAIEITVPDEFLDGATFPLVVDPILIPDLVIDDGAEDIANPDIFYKHAYNTFYIAYERVISAADHDVVLREYGSLGNPWLFGGETAIAITTVNERNPAVAGREDVVLTAFVSAGSGPRIKARRIFGSLSVPGTTFDVSDATAVAEDFPDLGVNDGAVVRPFLVVWQQKETSLATFTKVVGRPITDSGDVGPLLPIGQTAFAETHPAVNEYVRNESGVWLVGYHSVPQALRDVNLTVVGPSGLIEGSMILTATKPEDDHSIAIGGDGLDFCVSWLRVTAGSDQDLLGHAFRYSQSLVAQTATTDLCALDHPGVESLEQRSVDVGFDGLRYSIAYSEAPVGSPNDDAFVSEFLVDDGALVPFGTRTLIGGSSFPESDVSIASTIDDPQNLARHAVAWVFRGANDATDLYATLYYSFVSTPTQTVQTGCGTPELSITTSHPVIAGGPLLVETSSNAVAPLLLVGLPITGVPMCGGSSCQLGVTILSMLPVPTSFTGEIPADPSVIGAVIGLQFLEVLPPTATGNLCGPPKYAQKFRVSDTRVITIG